MRASDDKADDDFMCSSLRMLLFLGLPVRSADTALLIRSVWNNLKYVILIN
jgi:hypothetical protein